MAYLKKINFSVLAILSVMFVLMMSAAWKDSAIMDELAHIPAGYGYVTQLDYRLNPEHPPLLKAIAAFASNLAVRPYFPTDTSAWLNEVNGQWDQGTAFLYNSGNNADKIIFWARVPMMLITVIFGAILFWWTKNKFGKVAAYSTLLLFAFSPNFIANGHYVTTDVGAAFAFFAGITSFLYFLENPTWKRTILAGIIFGISELAKFSLILLVPLYGLFFIIWSLVIPHLTNKERAKIFWKLLIKTIVIGLIGLFIIWCVYFVFTLNYNQARQFNDANYILASYGSRTLANFDLTLIRIPALRPLGQFMLGILMVTQRTAGGNTEFFIGNISSSASILYFPILYLTKEPLALHILTIIALFLAIKKVWTKKSEQKKSDRIRLWIYEHFAEFSALAVILIYWSVSLGSNLNIGIRHVLPTFPFIYILVSRQISDWLFSIKNPNPQNLVQTMGSVFNLYLNSLPKFIFVLLMFIFMIVDTFAVSPYFLSYYNEFGGGIKNGYKIAVDSNFDWGQDLIRLKDFVNKNNIDKIAVSYFGGGNPQYYLGDKYVPWWSSKGPAHGWFAVSATFRESAFANPIKGFVQNPQDTYPWLKKYTPVGRAGTSIFIYDLP